MNALCATLAAAHISSMTYSVLTLFIQSISSMTQIHMYKRRRPPILGQLKQIHITAQKNSKSKEQECNAGMGKVYKNKLINLLHVIGHNLSENMDFLIVDPRNDLCAFVEAFKDTQSHSIP